MNWTKLSDRRWATDCSCRVTATDKADGTIQWIARNSHGIKIASFGFVHVEDAKSVVEHYINTRTDAGLFPYNR